MAQHRTGGNQHQPVAVLRSHPLAQVIGQQAGKAVTLLDVGLAAWLKLRASVPGSTMAFARRARQVAAIGRAGETRLGVYEIGQLGERMIRGEPLEAACPPCVCNQNPGFFHRVSPVVPAPPLRARFFRVRDCGKRVDWVSWPELLLKSYTNARFDGLTHG